MKYKINKRVYIDGITSLAQGGGESKIDEVGVRFNEMTGEPFDVYFIDDLWWNENGGCHSNPNFMYSVDYEYYDVKEPKAEEFTIDNKIYTLKAGEGLQLLRKTFIHETLLTFDTDEGSLMFKVWMKGEGKDLFSEYSMRKIFKEEV